MIILSSFSKIAGFILLFWLAIPLAPAQSFRFADTHPINKPDSLEAWLRANPKAPAVARLKNMITLERTYDWSNINKMGRYQAAIQQLLPVINDPAAKASFYFVKAEHYYLISQTSDAARYGNLALNLFKQQQDSSGLVHTYSLLVMLNIGLSGNSFTSHKSLFEQYIRAAEQHLSIDPHDRLYFYYCKFQLGYASYVANSKGPGLQQMKRFTDQSIRLVTQNPACRYAYNTTYRIKAALYTMQDDLINAHKTYIRLLKNYREDQVRELTGTYSNLASNCYYLGRYDEGLAYAQKGAFYAQKCTPVMYETLEYTYLASSQIAAKKHDFSKAYQFMIHKDSIRSVKIQAEGNVQMLNLQARYEFDRRQLETIRLQEQQKATERLNQVYLLGLGLAALLVTLLSWLWWRLRLTNAQLSTALGEVQQLTQNREYLIGIIAHDLRKPLVAFRGMTSLVATLLRQRAYADINDLSRAIDTAAVQIETMLNSLLQWALNQRDIILYHPKQISLAQVLHEIASLYRNLTQLDELLITVICAPDLTIWADPDSLPLIVRNLIDNAVKHVETAGSILVSAQSTPTGLVQIQVQDDGEGIDDKLLLFIQAMFAGRVQATVGKQGLGLGLLLVRDFVARHGGHIEVTSEAEKGTCFTVYLPQPTPANI